MRVPFDESINSAAIRDTAVSRDSRITISSINVARQAATPDAALSNLLWGWLVPSRMAAGIWSHTPARAQGATREL